MWDYGEQGTRAYNKRGSAWGGAASRIQGQSRGNSGKAIRGGTSKADDR